MGLLRSLKIMHNERNRISHYLWF